MAITVNLESVLSKLMLLGTVKLRNLGKVAVGAKRVARASCFPSAEPAFNLSIPFSESSFMGVQTPEYLALIGQPIEMLDQWQPRTIIEVGQRNLTPRAVFNRTANQKLWPCIARLGQGAKAPSSFSLIGEATDNMLILF